MSYAAAVLVALSTMLGCQTTTKVTRQQVHIKRNPAGTFVKVQTKDNKKGGPTGTYLKIQGKHKK